jgi:K(+)-stimulated pyrophosphate-energized sodium pump
MTELSLILGVAMVGLGLAGYLVRWVLARPVGDPEMNRVANLVRVASEAFSKRQTRTIGALSALLVGTVFLAYGLRSGGGDDIVPGLESGVCLTASCALGALSSIVIGQVAAFVFTRATIRVASGARRSVDQALVLALRSGAVVGLVASTIGALGHAALVLGILVYHGALSDDQSSALALVPHVPFLIAGYALGATFASLLAQLSGGLFAKAADVGADVGGREVGLLDDDLENPAFVADLAGDCVGGCGGRATAVFAAGAAEDLGAMLVGAVVFLSNPSLKSALSLILLPVLARAFGVLGTTFGVMVVRTDETEDPRSALVRGLIVSAILPAVGLAGAAKWLLPASFTHIVACVALGTIATLALVPLVHHYTLHRGPVRELSEASRAGPTLNFLGGISLGLDAVVVPVVIMTVTLLGAYAIGERMHLVSGGLFGIAMATLGMLGPSGYLLALDGAATIHDAASGIVVTTVGRDRPDVRGRLLVLETVGTASKALSRIHSAVVAGVSALLLVSAFLGEAARRSPQTSKLLPSLRTSSEVDPIHFIAGMLGVALVLWLGARTAGGVARASRRIIEEVRRQLGGRAAEGFEAPQRSREAPAVDHGPCVEMASRLALRLMFAPALLAVLGPVLVALGLRLFKSEDNPLSAVDSVAALIVAATVAGVLGSLLLAAASGAWGNAKKYIVTGAHGGRLLVDETGARAENPTFFAAFVGDTVGDPLKDAALPVALVFIKMLPVLALVLLPFLL